VQVKTRYSTSESSLSLTRPLSQFSTKSRVWLVVSSATRNGDFKIYHVSFLPYLSLEKLCKELNTTVGQGIWYHTLQVQNTKWLWLVNICYDN